MASLTNEPNGRKRIQFTAPNGSRRTIRLGKMPMRSANAVKLKIENILASKLSGHALDDETARWIANLDSVLVDRLANAGLIERREVVELQPFLEAYFEARSDVKESTKTNWRHTRRNLIEYFGPETSIRAITSGDAAEWRLSLIRAGLADNTVRKRCSNAKQFFNSAVAKELIPSNPFAELKSAVIANRRRFYFISRDEADRVIAACPDAQWRLLFALSRYGGLRCPSEHLSLRWENIDWAGGRIRIHSPKTEHLEGHDWRIIPLFPELRPYLEDAYEIREPSDDHVITRYRRTNTNLRTQLMKIIRRAGLKPWPKLFQNLRSSRQTELEEQFPSHVVCTWIGNSPGVAKKHYLQVTEEHLRKAADVEATQNPTQQDAAAGRTGVRLSKPENEKRLVSQDSAPMCAPVQYPGRHWIRTSG